MDGQSLDVIPKDSIAEAIQAAIASLPDPLTSSVYAPKVDVVSRMGAPCTVQFQLLPHNWPDTVWQWQAVGINRAGLPV